VFLLFLSGVLLFLSGAFIFFLLFLSQ